MLGGTAADVTKTGIWNNVAGFSLIAACIRTIDGGAVIGASGTEEGSSGERLAEVEVGEVRPAIVRVGCELGIVVDMRTKRRIERMLRRRERGVDIERQ